MTAWLTVLLPAIDFAITQAKALGLDPPGMDEVAKIKAAVDERLGQVLPLAIVGVAASAVAVAVKAKGEIDSLPDSPTCPKCGAVATQHISHSPHSGRSDVTLSCGACGWASS